VLFLHLKRFDNELRVRPGVISFPGKLDLRPCCHGSHAPQSTNSADERKYALIGVIMHRCTDISLQSGHYWAYARTVDGDWLECDDARVTEVTEAIVLKAGAGSAGGGSAYMLVYEAVSQPGQRLSRITRV
jgi:ubiquitin C-terminal hydrolase